jgi:transcriptional regulator with XRE-family HTH domain
VNAQSIGVLPLRVLLRERRLRLGLSTEEAASACGVQQSAYSKWELGRTKPGDEYLAGIAMFLELPTAVVTLARSSDRVPDVTEPDSDRLARLEGQVAEMMEVLRSLRLPPDSPESQGT